MDKEFDHKHRCPECGTIWAHTAKARGKPDYHKCPHCNRPQWELYDGDDEPEIVQEVVSKRRWWKSTTSRTQR